MPLTELQRQGRLRSHRTSSREISDLLRLAARDMEDAAVGGLSADRRFMTAYEAVVALATIPLCCAGYRTEGAGHHQTIFLALPMTMGEEVRELAAYFDTCRTKRNISAYDRAGAVSDLEAKELLEEAHALQKSILAWLKTNHPKQLR